jgi:T-complex protein 1 subunit gamma
LTALRAKHGAAYEEDENAKCHWGINGITGELVDMQELGIWEPFSVKVQTIKTAIESACMIL